jgi:hypothetical protein
MPFSVFIGKKGCTEDIVSAKYFLYPKACGIKAPARLYNVHKQKSMEQQPINRNFAAQFVKMSYGESEERRQSRSSFRITQDIGMGLLYTAVGIAVMAARAFGSFEIRPAVVAYVLGGMMAVGGGFRFYRGIKEVLRKKKD